MVVITLDQVPAKNLKRITSYVSPDAYEILEKWASLDGRSVSNLVSRIIDKAVKEYSEEQQSDRQ